MRLVNALRIHAGALDASGPTNRWGIVQSVNTAAMTAKVLIQPENILSGWLPVLSNAAGPGSGDLNPPLVGQQVLLAPDAGDHESYVILGSTWNTAGMPPPGAVSGERWIVAFGTSIKLLATGHVLIADASGATVELQNNGTVAITAPTLAVTGNITLAGTLAVTGEITVGGTVVSVP